MQSSSDKRTHTTAHTLSNRAVDQETFHLPRQSSMTQWTLDEVTDHEQTSDSQAGQSDSSQTGYGDLARRGSFRHPDEDGPSHDVDWEPPGAEYNLRTRWATSSFELEASAGRIDPSEFRFIVGGEHDLKTYLAAYGDTQVRVPKTFSSLHEDWESYLGVYTQLGPRDGYGITARALEKAIRILSGSGAYRSTNFTVVGCGELPWVVLGQTGTLLCSPVPVSADSLLDLPRTDQCHIGGSEVSVNEEATAVLRGLERFDALLNTRPWANPVGYAGNTSTRRGCGRHLIKVEYEQPPTAVTTDSPDGDDPAEVTVSADDLAELGTARSLSALSELLPPAVEPTASVGDSTDLGVCAGYRLDTAHSESNRESWRVLKEIYLSWGDAAPRGLDYATQQRHTRFEVNVRGRHERDPNALNR